MSARASHTARNGKRRRRNSASPHCTRRPAQRPTNHVVPRGNNRFHVEVAGEERNDAVWDDLGVFDEDTAEIANHCRVIANFEPRADSDLVAAARNDLH